MAADPIRVGVVYLETDYLESDQDVGGDSNGDRFILSFTGGAANTELREIRIRTDKDGDGISVGDPIFDTAAGGRGKNGFHDFRIVGVHSEDGREIGATADVDDGGQELVIRLDQFRAGDRLEFTLDVDEVLRNVPDLDLFNQRLDVITSGQEFQDSILEATFRAPHFQEATADAVFLNDFGDPAASHGLKLPPDDGNDVDSRPNRSAAALASTVQVPKPVSISGHVWLDNDLDRSRESGEQRLSGVQLSLWKLNPASGSYGDTGHRTSTDAAGRYVFPKSLGLTPGTYRVVESQPEGLFSVAAVPGSVDGTAVGSAGSLDVISGIEIPLGDLAAVDYDFAEAAPAEVSGHVYRDDNDNGRRDAGERGIAGTRIELTGVAADGSQHQRMATTDADGAYAFTDLAPGDYILVQLDQPASLDDGRDAAGRVNGVSAGAAVNPGDQINGIRLDGGAVGVDYDFGELPLGSLAGVVYLAAPGRDCGGSHDLTVDTPLSGVEVILETPNGSVIAETTTNADGGYRFGSLSKGTYRIRQVTPEGLIDGGARVGTIGGVSAGVPEGGGMIRNIALAAGGIGTEYNFCEAAPARISGTVYHDASNDGLRDPSETGIPGATVTLVDTQGRIVAETATDAIGRYEFDGIPPGTYSLLQTQPAGFLDGRDTPGTVDGKPRGRVGSDGDSLRDIELPQGTVGTAFNFGELVAASISGRVHADLDDDCRWDPGEARLGGVTVRLLDAGGNEVARATTDQAGTYRFDEVAPGTYSVEQIQPEGYFDGTAKAGTAGGHVTGPNHVTEITLLSGQDADGYDFCEQPAATLSGIVHADRDGDCVVDANEPGIAGVRVELYDRQGTLVATARTDASGAYRFTGLRSGMYTVREIQPAGWLQGGQSAGSHGGDASLADTISTIPVGWGETLTDYNFCELPPSEISGRVWSDVDLDQRFDEGETPISGVRVELVDTDGNAVSRQQTGDDGRYRFTGLAPGDYSVRETQPDGYFHGGQVIGSAGGAVAADDLVAGIVLEGGTVASGYHFPEVPPATISGYVFQDGPPLRMDAPPDPPRLREFRDGLKTHDDVMLGGVTLELRNLLGQPVTADRALGDAYPDGPIRVTTDAGGYYEFGGLRPGTYHVYQVQPEAWLDGLDTPGTGGGLAVNPADSVDVPEDQILIQTLSASAATDPNDDAILNVALSAGGRSRENNFSEIRVERLVAPPLVPPQVEPEVMPPRIETFPAPELLMSFGVPPRIDAPRIYANEWAMSWHLSVINAGFPRGEAAADAVRNVAFAGGSERWDRDELDFGRWYVAGLEGAGEAAVACTLGHPDAMALTGDFNGDGLDEAVLFVGGQWFVDLNGNGHWDPDDLWIKFGTELDRPAVGDWDGDGKDDVAIFGRQWARDPQRIRKDPGLPDPDNIRRRRLDRRELIAAQALEEEPQQRRWLQRGARGDLRADAVDHVFHYGDLGDHPLAGDWNGDGIDQIAVFRGGSWLLDRDGDGRWASGEQPVAFGQPGDEPVVGDFNGDGIDEIGVVRGETWIIDTDGDNRMTANDLRLQVPRPEGESQPIVGDFDGDGKADPGYYSDAA